MEYGETSSMAEAEEAFELMNDLAKNESLVYQNTARLKAIKNDRSANPAKIAALETMVEQRTLLVERGKLAQSLFEFELNLIAGDEE